MTGGIRILAAIAIGLGIPAAVVGALFGLFAIFGVVNVLTTMLVLAIVLTAIVFVGSAYEALGD